MEKIPDRPWQKIGIDLFKNKLNWYMVIIDYYSRFLEIFCLHNLTEETVIVKCKDTFSRYGIPQVVRTDCGTQFKAKFVEFSQQYGFQLVTSSPYFPQSNGMAEAGVKIAKQLLEKNDDIYMALLIYRNTPLESGYSPAELMFGRKLREILPIVSSELIPTKVSVEKFRDTRLKKKCRDAQYYNNRHNTRNLKQLNVGDKVFVIDLKHYGKILKCGPEPRTYLIETGRGIFRRNRWHIISCPLDLYNNNCENENDYSIDDDNDNISVVQEDDSSNNDNNTPPCSEESRDRIEVNRSERVRRKPNYLNDYEL